MIHLSVRTILSGFVALSLLPLTARGDEAAPTFTTKAAKVGDDCKADVGKDGVVFTVASKTGIGKASMTLDSGKWPAKITVRFLNLPSLEQLKVLAGRAKLEGKLKSGEGRSTFYFDKDGKSITDRTKAVYTLAIEKKKDLIEVVLTTPPEAGEVKTWGLDWIDALR